MIDEFSCVDENVDGSASSYQTVAELPDTLQSREINKFNLNVRLEEGVPQDFL